MSGSAVAGADAPPASRSGELAPMLTPAEHERITDIALRLDGGDATGARELADALLRDAPANSYARALAHVWRTQALLAGGDLDEAAADDAAASLQYAIASGYFPDGQTLEWQYVLAQLHVQAGRYEEAMRELQAWLARTPSPTPQAFALYASSALQARHHAGASGETASLERALQHIETGLRLGVRPDETLLLLKAACLQELGRPAEAAEVMEFLLDRKPAEPGRWEQLYSLYAGDGQNLAAVLTIERAREHGSFQTAQADFALGQLYHALGQDHRALDAVTAGLDKGVAEPAGHAIFAAYLACRCGDLARAETWLDIAENHPLTEAQHGDVASLHAAVDALRDHQHRR